MLTRKNDKLANLPAEDRARLDAWLQNEPYRRVLQLVAAPRPEGLALKTNLRALSRYFNKFLAPNPLDELTDLALHNPQAAETAVATLLLQQSITGALQLGGNSFDFRKFGILARFQQRLNDQTNSEQWLALQQQFCELRSMSSGMLHFVTPKNIPPGAPPIPRPTPNPLTPSHG